MRAVDVLAYIFIQTAGQASLATREFLHLLDEKISPEVPFLYISDHDFDGFGIYSVLKYGSAGQAFCSPTVVCPRLQWVGPTKADLEASPADFKEQYRQQYALDHPHQSEEAVAAVVDAWEQKQAQKIEHKYDKVTRCDKTKIVGWKNKGWLQHESPIVQSEVEAMIAGRTKFRLADMAVVGIPFLRQYIEQKVNLLTPIPIPLPVRARLVPARSPIGQKYARLESQSQISAPVFSSESVAPSLDAGAVTEEQQKELLLKVAAPLI